MERVTPRDTSPFPTATARIIGERSALFACALGLSESQLSKIVVPLVRARRIASLDKLDGDGAALLILAALLRPEPRDVLRISDALLNTVIRLEADEDGYRHANPEHWKIFPNAVATLGACLFPTTLLERVSVAVERLDEQIFVSVSFDAVIRTVWATPIDDDWLRAIRNAPEKSRAKPCGCASSSRGSRERRQLNRARKACRFRCATANRIRRSSASEKSTRITRVSADAGMGALSSKSNEDLDT